MTQTLIPPPRASGHWAAPEPTMADLVGYARRIHWWVRLFGVVIVGWVVLSLVGAVLMIAAMAANTST